MKVVHFSFSDAKGGAAKAAYTLVNSLEWMDEIDNKLIVLKKETDADFIHEVLSESYISKIKANLILYFGLSNMVTKCLHGRPKIFWSSSVFGCSCALKALYQADVIGLYWICNLLSPELVGTILMSNKPVVWRLSDMWPFTGGCHYAGDCKKYETECKDCPQLSRKSFIDLSHIVWKSKVRHWQNKDNLTIVAPSRWIADCARKSFLFRDCRIERIPSGTDLTIFKPVDKTQARDLLQLPQDKKLILFGAVNALGEPRKGGTYLLKALNLLRDYQDARDIEVVVFGTHRSLQGQPFQAHSLGYLHDNVTLALVYSACDVFVAPSLEDNLPNTVIESLACGTPCVAFNIGGMPDMIEHQQNGYLAARCDGEDLARGIIWILEDEDRYRELSLQAREKAENEFDIKKIAKRYVELYKHVKFN